jgi:methionyl-tRNA formyltransferase
MLISIICSDRQHPSWPKLQAWCDARGANLESDVAALGGGDLLICVSCTQFVPASVRGRFRKSVVIHESDLPNGRGWSPVAWGVLAGESRFVVSLIECAEQIDSGRILKQAEFHLEGHELADEIAAARDAVRLKLIEWAATFALHTEGVEQVGEATFHRRRMPQDSRLDPEKNIAEQFDLLRICEDRFPAFFDLRGHRYELRLSKFPQQAKEAA